ncbi:MAG: peptide chain release factor-like protein, partial [Planctomycetes bacterium]|nr:peptide chain release factor-like protein [Planctomycetota bacterium]
SDLEESFVRGQGKGGQKVNKTHNCVVLKHLPSGVNVRCHKERSRELNRFFARRLLADALEVKKSGITEAGKALRDKIRKKKKKKAKRAQDKTTGQNE